MRSGARHCGGLAACCSLVAHPAHPKARIRLRVWRSTSGIPLISSIFGRDSGIHKCPAPAAASYKPSRPAWPNWPGDASRNNKLKTSRAARVGRREIINRRKLRRYVSRARAASTRQTARGQQLAHDLLNKLADFNQAHLIWPVSAVQMDFSLRLTSGKTLGKRGRYRETGLVGDVLGIHYFYSLAVNTALVHVAEYKIVRSTHCSRSE